MRALFILFGAPGVGKSTLIETLGVQHLTIGFDQMRDLFGIVVPCVDETGLPMMGAESTVRRIRNHDEFTLVKATFAALESRMAAGSTVFFDATSLTIKSQNELIVRARAYGYTPYLLDVQGDMTLEQLRERNAKRGPRALSDTVLAEKWHAGREKNFAQGVTLIDTSSIAATRAHIAEVTATPELSADRVIVVGDVHSCAEALRAAIAEHDAPGTQWVFSGDLFDRGPDPVGVWNIVTRLIAEGRCTVVTGNHESNLRAVNTHTGKDRLRDTVATRDALLQAGIIAQEQQSFVNATVPALLIARPGFTKPWLVTHGGVGHRSAERLRGERSLLNIADAECIYGLSERDKAYRGATSYDVDRIELAGHQLHGHRNGGRRNEEPVPAIRDFALGPIVCLESDASAGGDVSVAVLDPAAEHGVRVFTYPDGVDAASAAHFRKAPCERKNPLDSAELLQRLRASEHVKVREVPGFPGVVAANFTRRAFIDGAWDDVSIHARGLFFDENTGEIVARGYEKFFHIGEAPGRDLDQWLNPNVTGYPVAAVKKYNGYLALVASIQGKLAVFSKSGVTPYGEKAHSMLLAAIGDDGAEQLRQMLERTNSTATFEVIRGDDPHPIAETGGDRLVLLDAIHNTATFATNPALARGIAARFGFESAATQVIGRAERPEGFAALQQMIAARADEGAVLLDARGYRSKIKADLYASRKAARGALERYWRGASDTLGPRHRELEAQLHGTGVLRDIRAGRFTVTGLDGNPRLDLAGIFEACELIAQP